MAAATQVAVATTTATVAAADAQGAAAAVARAYVAETQKAAAQGPAEAAQEADDSSVNSHPKFAHRLEVLPLGAWTRATESEPPISPQPNLEILSWQIIQIVSEGILQLDQSTRGGEQREKLSTSSKQRFFGANSLVRGSWHRIESKSFI